MKYLFQKTIHNFSSWEQVFQSIEAWESLINFILKKEKLPVSKIENLEPGSNAVFKSGGYVVKIFAPKESELDGCGDYQSELFALSFAQSLGVSVPKLIANGEIEDKYNFRYMIMEYIEGISFEEASAKFTVEDKFAFAKKMRKITDLLNKPREPFNGIDVIHDESRYKRWDKFSQRFKKERVEYVRSHDFGANVFVHGDLCSDNVLLDNNGSIFIIDFADSVAAPQVYERAHLAGELFKFEKPYLHGYFGEYQTDELTDLCFDGLLIHDFGGDIVAANVATPRELNCLSNLRDKIYGLIR